MQSREQQISIYIAARFDRYRDEFRALSAIGGFIINDIAIIIAHIYAQITVNNMRHEFSMAECNHLSSILHAHKWHNGYAFPLFRPIVIRDQRRIKTFQTGFGGYYLEFRRDGYRMEVDVNDPVRLLCALVSRYTYSGWVGGEFVIWVTSTGGQLCWK